MTTGRISAKARLATAVSQTFLQDDRENIAWGPSFKFQEKSIQ
jgi:hypothetical protein